jgi:hypothetical protein
MQGVGQAPPAQAVHAKREEGRLAQVQVHIDKPRQHVAAAEIQDLVGGRRPAPARLVIADRDHAALVNQQPGSAWPAGRLGPDGPTGQQSAHPHLPAPDAHAGSSA